MNCGNSGHPANFQQCPAYKKIKQSKTDSIQHQQHQQKFKRQSYSNLVNNNVSFANITKKNSNGNSNCNTNIFPDLYSSFPRPDETKGNRRSLNARQFRESETAISNKRIDNGKTNFEFLNSECTNLFGISFIDLIRQINNFLPEYKISKIKR